MILSIYLSYLYRDEQVGGRTGEGEQADLCRNEWLPLPGYQRWVLSLIIAQNHKRETVSVVWIVFNNFKFVWSSSL